MKCSHQFSLLFSFMPHFITLWTEWVWLFSLSERATHLCLTNLLSTHIFPPIRVFAVLRVGIFLKNQGMGNFGGGNKVIQNFVDISLSKYNSFCYSFLNERDRNLKKSSHVFRSYEVYLLSLVFKGMGKHKVTFCVTLNIPERPKSGWCFFLLQYI